MTNTTRFGTGPGAFDPRYYLAKNPDVARQLAGLQGNEKSVAALRHFIDYGAKELRNPSAQFDMKAYLNAFPDVAAAGVNPLLHFRQHGAAEGRRAIPVQEGTRVGRAVVLPAAVAGPDAAVFDLTRLPAGSAVLGHGGPGLAFQTAAADTLPGCPEAGWAPVSAPYMGATGPALLQHAIIQAIQPSGHTWLPPQPGLEIPAAIPHGAVAETLLPVTPGAIAFEVLN